MSHGSRADFHASSLIAEIKVTTIYKAALADWDISRD